MSNIFHFYNSFFFKHYLRYAPSRQTRFLFVSILVGIIIGFVSIFIRYLTIQFQIFYFGSSQDLLLLLKDLPWYVRIFSPCLGGLLVGILSNTFFYDCKGDGVERVMFAVAKQSGKLSLNGVFGRIFSSAIVVGSGGSTGKEGPIIHIAGGIASFLGRLFKFNQEYVKILVGVGVASGIAAGFNAPIAGTFFAVEILLGDFTIHTFMPIILAAVAATVVSGIFIPHPIPFANILKNYYLTSPIELLFFFGLGILTALCSYVFVRNLLISEDFFNRLPIPNLLKPAVGGLMVGLIGYQMPEIMGLGYQAMKNIIQGDYDLFINSPWLVLSMLLVFKILSTGFTISSGGTGGTLIPSLFLGCVVGGLFSHFFSFSPISPGLYAIVGMAGVLAGTTQAPIMSIMLFFEFTNSYQIIFPVVIVSFTSTWLTMYMLGGSIYTVKLKKLGVDLYNNIEKTLMARISVSEIYSSNFLRIHEKQSIFQVFDLFSRTKHRVLFVTNENKEFKGILSFNQLRGLINMEKSESYKYSAGDFMAKNTPTVLRTDNLSLCMEFFSSSNYNEEVLPVILSKDTPILIGYVDQKKIWLIYNMEIGKRSENTVRFDARSLGGASKRYLDFSENYRFEFIEVPQSFIGKNSFELNIRKTYGITVIAIQSEDSSKYETINPERIFKEGDYLAISGENKKIDHFLTKIE